ncbi:MAG TPA: hypothetical protein VK186_01855 [Candidatus Deferrimicrobium sp.]|nr:hypothetical protein [Candidatus Deferrimicrobium sp.]
MIEIVKINWILIVAHAGWLLGAAIILTLLAIMEFSRSPRQIPVKMFGVSFGLIVFGFLLLNFKIPTSKLLVSRITGLNEAGLSACVNSLSFPVSDIKMDELNGRHERNSTDIVDNTLALFYDGFMVTPLVKFNPGEYMVEFKARGTKALDEYATVKVEFEKLEGQYLIVKTHRFIILSKAMEKHGMKFPVENDGIGRIKITFVNDDLESGGKKDRNVWLKDISLTRINKSF